MLIHKITSASNKPVPALSIEDKTSSADLQLNSPAAHESRNHLLIKLHLSFRPFVGLPVQSSVNMEQRLGSAAETLVWRHMSMWHGTSTRL